MRLEKIKNYEVSWLLFDVYHHLAKPDDEVDMAGDLQCGCAFSEKKYADADNDAFNPNDVEALLSYVLNCTHCHSDEYSSRFFSCHPCYWNKSGCLFLKFHCDIKQFHRNMKQFHWSIKQMENTTMEFHCSIQKAPFCPLCGVSCGTYPIHVLTRRYTTWSAEKNLFNDVPNFKIKKMNFQIIHRYVVAWLPIGSNLWFSQGVPK